MVHGHNTGMLNFVMILTMFGKVSL